MTVTIGICMVTHWTSESPSTTTENRGTYGTHFTQLKIPRCMRGSSNATWNLAGRAPEAFFSDRSGALLAAVAQTMPETRHFICLHHLLGNIADHVRSSANAQMPGGWDTFQSLFWVAYRAVSPERIWEALVGLGYQISHCREYLDNELYPSRRQWAWAWIGKEFYGGHSN